jgi:3'-phosphoadenosine 5'-phosphosulfate sulfotransferase (PAPS reductase)/FAD synthetase
MSKDSKKIIVPVSGGKDSTVCLCLAIDKVGVDNVIPVFNDTGWEHPLTYEYLDYLEERLDIKINRTKGGQRGEGLIDVIRKQGRFPFGMGRFCTMYLKQYALRDWYKDNLFDGETQYEVWFGMRTDESNQRAKKYAGLSPDDVFDMGDLFPSRYNKKLRATLVVRLPVVDWSTHDIFAHLYKIKVKHNPLYNEGTNDRVGCYPCLLAGKKVQKKMFATEVGQERLKIIKALEVEMGVKYEMFDTDQGSCEICKI